MELKNTSDIVQTLQLIREDVRHVRNDVDILKAFLLEDSILTEDERTHIKKTLENLRSRKMEEFVPLDKV